MSVLLVQSAAALAIVGALFFVRRKLAGRAGAGAAALEIRHRRELGRDCGVAVVAWNGREVLVGYGASGIRVLVDTTGPRGEVLP